jgi:adenylate cyclase
MARAVGAGGGKSQEPASLATRRKSLFGVVVLVLFGVLCSPLFVSSYAVHAPGPKGGEVSFAHWGALAKPIRLNGQWTLIWHGDGIHRSADRRLLARVPGPWEGLAAPDGSKLPQNGFASYELTIRDLPPGQYTLHVPDEFSASRVWIDGTLESSTGVAGNSRETTQYLWRSQDVPVASTGMPVRIRIDMSAFYHRNNGMEEAPVIGLSTPMRTWATLAWSREFLFCISLLLLAINGVVVFVFRPSDRASLYTGLSCLFFIPSVSVFGYDNLLMIVLPGLSFPAMLAIQYLTGIVAMVFFLAYANALFPRESPRPFYLAIEFVLFGLFAMYATLFARGDTLLASQLIPFNMIWNAVAVAYIVGVVAVATARGRDGALVFLLGIALFAIPLVIVFAVLGSLLDSDKVVGYELMPLGILMLVFSHIVILSERWSVAIRAAEEMNADLRRLIDVSASITSEIHLETLLKKIVQTTSQFLHADRSSLFLYNPKTHELEALVAEGVKTRQIHLDSHLGIVGHCFTTGEIVNIADAYKDARFNRHVDEETGYRTRSVLAMPVTARDGRRLGVMQALNRHDAKAFSEADEEKMSAVAAQAAISIENATLFSEVVSARNYNESILRSMSNGVITFDADARIAKVNTSGAAILGLDPDAVTGMDARALFGASNPWILEELAAVGADHQPRGLLDVDVRTGSGNTLSANINIVPLLGEAETPVGILFLIEDISEEKRLGSAMRRFMTQKVVDQVLQRQDGLLFGTSCEASVLFADIRNFTSMAEALTARETVDMLNEIFTELVEAVAANDGVLDKFMGDAVMAVFGAPFAGPHDPENAVACAISMMHLLAQLNTRRKERGQENLKLGIGIATGSVIAGTIGSPKRMDYTVIGDSVNLASRLQVLTKLYRVGVIACEATASVVKDYEVIRELDVIRVRGREKPEKIFQLLSYHTEQSFPNMAGVLAAYARGRDCIASRDWNGAVAAFEDALALNPGDEPSRLMLSRVTVLVSRPPSPDWDGIWSSGDTHD